MIGELKKSEVQIAIDRARAAYLESQGSGPEFRADSEDGRDNSTVGKKSRDAGNQQSRSYGEWPCEKTLRVALGWSRGDVLCCPTEAEARRYADKGLTAIGPRELLALAMAGDIFPGSRVEAIKPSP